MALFWFVAGVLVGVAASRIGVPLCRSAASRWRSAAWLTRARLSWVRAGALAASFALAVGILYLSIGSRHPPVPPEKSTAASPGAAATTPGARRDWRATAGVRRTGPCWHRHTTSSGGPRMPNGREPRPETPPRGRQPQG